MAVVVNDEKLAGRAKDIDLVGHGTAAGEEAGAAVEGTGVGDREGVAAAAAADVLDVGDRAGRAATDSWNLAGGYQVRVGQTCKSSRLELHPG